MSKFSTVFQRNASTALSVGSLHAAAGGPGNPAPRRTKIYELCLGSEGAPDDKAILWQIQKATAIPAGSPPAALITDVDDDDTTAATAQLFQNVNPDPALAAGAIKLHLPLNQRGTYRWMAAPGGELMIPGVANSGLAVRTPSILPAPAGPLPVSAQVFFQE